MPKFLVTVRESETWFLHKVFEASSRKKAQELAELDDSWTEEDGWEFSDSEAGDSYVDRVSEIKPTTCEETK